MTIKSFICNLNQKITTWQFKDELPEDEKIRAIGNAAQATAAGGAADFGFADHQVVIQDLIDAVRTGREVIIPVENVRPTLEIVLAMYQSAARNEAVRLPVTDDSTIWK